MHRWPFPTRRDGLSECSRRAGLELRGKAFLHRRHIADLTLGTDVHVSGIDAGARPAAAVEKHPRREVVVIMGEFPGNVGG